MVVARVKVRLDVRCDYFLVYQITCRLQIKGPETFRPQTGQTRCKPSSLSTFSEASLFATPRLTINFVGIF